MQILRSLSSMVLELSSDLMKAIFARGKKKMVTEGVIKMNENEASYTYTSFCML